METDYDIIAVDDDTIEHEIMARALRKTSYRIKCFESADEAFTFLASHQPRYLFVDYRMPSGDGIEFIVRLATAMNIAGIKVYLTSSSDVPEAVLAQTNSLGAEFILKNTISSPGYLANLCDQDGKTTSSE